jgi:hypothetical protein
MDRHQSAIESVEQTKPERKKSRSERAYMAVIGTALTAAALAGCSTNAEAQSPEPVVTHSVEATPSETPSPASSEIEKAPQVELGPITPDMSPKEKANRLEAIRTAWLFHGVETYEDLVVTMDESGPYGIDEFNELKSLEAEEKYAPLLFGENWKEDLQQEELQKSGAAKFFENLKEDYSQNLYNAFGLYSDGYVPSMETKVSNATDEVSDTLDENEHGLLYDVDFKYINATNADPTTEIRLGFNLTEQSNGTLAITGMAQHPQPEAK